MIAADSSAHPQLSKSNPQDIIPIPVINCLRSTILLHLPYHSSQHLSGRYTADLVKTIGLYSWLYSDFAPLVPDLAGVHPPIPTSPSSPFSPVSTFSLFSTFSSCHLPRYNFTSRAPQRYDFQARSTLCPTLSSYCFILTFASHLIQ